MGSGGNLNWGTLVVIRGEGEGWAGLGGVILLVNGAGLEGVDEVVDEGFELESPVDDATPTGTSWRAMRMKYPS